MERPNSRDFKYWSDNVFLKMKYIEDLEIYCNKLESSYNKLLEQLENKDKLSK